MRRHTALLLMCCLMGSVGLAAAWPDAAEGVVIAFQASDLPDALPGEDRWSYTYLVTDADIPAGAAFEVLFDPALYGRLDDPPAGVNTDWDVIVLQPDDAIPDAGRYSALALVEGASVADAFIVGFTWLGGAGTVPGAQPFEVLQLDDLGNVVGLLEAGDTTPAPFAVPLPGTLALVSTAAAGLILRRRSSASALR
jgi:hypothetical protein